MRHNFTHELLAQAHYLTIIPWSCHITSTPRLPSIAGTLTDIVKPSIAKPDL